jgi:hypothetical protein
MAQAAQSFGEERSLLMRYLRNLARTGYPERPGPSPGHQVRTCPACGGRASFSLDPEGTWYRCHRCGHYA